MTFGVNGLGNSKGKPAAGAKPSVTPGEAAKAEAVGSVAAAADALALGDYVEATSSRVLAQEFAEKMKRLQTAAPDPAAYDRLEGAIGSETYLLIDSLNRLCRDTQAEPFEERLKTLRAIQHLHALPEELRQAIEDDLRRTSPAA